MSNVNQKKHLLVCFLALVPYATSLLFFRKMKCFYTGICLVKPCDEAENGMLTGKINKSNQERTGFSY